MIYLVVYDICDPKRLNKVAKYLEKIGIRTQNSTFELDNNINNIIITAIFNDLTDICEEEDKIFIYKVLDKIDIQQDTNNWEMVF